MPTKKAGSRSQFYKWLLGVVGTIFVGVVSLWATHWMGPPLDTPRPSGHCAQYVSLMNDVTRKTYRRSIGELVIKSIYLRAERR